MRLAAAGCGRLPGAGFGPGSSGTGGDDAAKQEVIFMGSSKSTPALPRTYTAEEVSQILQIPLIEVYRAGAAGEIPGRIRVGRRTRFNADAIDRLIRGEAA